MSKKYMKVRVHGCNYLLSFKGLKQIVSNIKKTTLKVPKFLESLSENEKMIT